MSGQHSRGESPARRLRPQCCVCADAVERSPGVGPLPCQGVDLALSGSATEPLTCWLTHWRSVEGRVASVNSGADARIS
jgi:hypothetical protein